MRLINDKNSGTCYTISAYKYCLFVPILTERQVKTIFFLHRFVHMYRVCSLFTLFLLYVSSDVNFCRSTLFFALHQEAVRNNFVVVNQVLCTTHCTHHMNGVVLVRDREKQKSNAQFSKKPLQQKRKENIISFFLCCVFFRLCAEAKITFYKDEGCWWWWRRRKKEVKRRNTNKKPHTKNDFLFFVCLVTVRHWFSVVNEKEWSDRIWIVEKETRRTSKENRALIEHWIVERVFFTLLNHLLCRMSVLRIRMHIIRSMLRDTEWFSII